MPGWTSPQYLHTVSEQGVCHFQLGHSTHQNMRELYLGADSEGDLWALFCGTAAPAIWLV